jgi:hypothetical protein
MTPNLKKQEILNQIAAILNHPGWKVSSGSTEPRNASFYTPLDGLREVLVG